MVEVEVGGVKRSYILRVPPSYDGKSKVPMVILLHGATDSAAYAEEAYHFAEKADDTGFILVLPDALGEFHAWHGLDADTPEAPNNDLAFLDLILATVPKAYAVDADRVYVCGHSSGAIMAYRLAAERPDAIAAAGIVAGTVGDTRSDPPRTIPTPKGPVPLVIFHGKLDSTLPYDGGNPGIASVAESVAFWGKANHCANAPSRRLEVMPPVQEEVWDSPVGAEIDLYTVEDGNHMWPGGKIMPGKDQEPVQDISATDVMWDFFANHPRRPRGK
ncbi:MAG: alpha/beta hydrolase family esterase [Phycisphaerae bacterium]